MFSSKISVKDGTILCGQRGGNVRAEENQSVRWFSEDEPFTLDFFRTPEEGEESDPVRLDGWPFSEPVRAQDVKWPASSFEGVLKKGHGVFKYVITVGNLRLDPIIIVDRRP